MTFTLGRSGPLPCQRDCAEFIVADGEIGPDSAAEFLALWSRLPRKDLPLMLNSPGGRLDGAMALGRALRHLNVTVTVARARRLGTETPGVAQYAARLDAGICHSACVYTLAGASRRNMAPGSEIGVHQFYLARASDTKRRPKQQYSDADFGRLQSTVAALAGYLVEMQVDLRLLTLAAETEPSRIRVLSSGEVAELLPAAVMVERAAAPPLSAASLHPSLSTTAPPSVHQTPGWPLVMREGRPWLVLQAESQSRRFGVISNEVAIGCRSEGADFVATFREILPPGRPASEGSARIATGSDGGTLAHKPGADHLRGTISQESTMTAAQSGTLDVDVTTVATANYPMRISFAGKGLMDGIDRLERACTAR